VTARFSVYQGRHAIDTSPAMLYLIVKTSGDEARPSAKDAANHPARGW